MTHGRALTARAQAGDVQAFQQIYERHAPSVYGFLRDLLGDDSAADEATQETFVRAHGKLATLRDPTRLSAWLFGIARRVYLEKRRSDRYAAARREEPAAPPPPPADPESLLLGREADSVLAEALATLAPRRRAALLLRMDQGLSYDQIAESMGWTLGTVKIELYRARNQLRAHISKYLGGR